jgi:hypothetical protein
MANCGANSAPRGPPCFHNATRVCSQGEQDFAGAWVELLLLVRSEGAASHLEVPWNARRYGSLTALVMAAPAAQ